MRKTVHNSEQDAAVHISIFYDKLNCGMYVIRVTSKRDHYERSIQRGKCWKDPHRRDIRELRRSWPTVGSQRGFAPINRLANVAYL